MNGNGVEEGGTYEREDGGRFVVLPAWVLAAPISDGALRLYCVLADYANRDGRSWPTRKALGERMGCSVDTVDRRVTELIDAHLLSKTARRTAAGDPTSNLWILRVRPPRKSAKGGRTDAQTGRGTDAALTRTNYEQEAENASRRSGDGFLPVDNPAPRTPEENVRDGKCACGYPRLADHDVCPWCQSVYPTRDGGPALAPVPDTGPDRETARAIGAEGIARAREILESKGRHPSGLFDPPVTDPSP